MPKVTFGKDCSAEGMPVDPNYPKATDPENAGADAADPFLGPINNWVQV